MCLREIKTAFVTGATGFIGRSLVAELLRSGVHVRVLVRKAGASRMWQQPVEEIVGDLFTPDALAGGAKDADVVFHLAGIGSPSSPEDMHPQIIRTNAVGTMNALVAASNEGARRVVLSSSASVYGKRSSPSLSEDLPPEPASVYASSKHIAEEMCAAATRHQGIETVVLRYFNVYGPGEAINGMNRKLIPSLIHRLVTDQPITVFGQGQQTRDFIYVEDAVRATMQAGQAGNMRHEIVNIGSGHRASVIDIVTTLREMVDSSAKIVHEPIRPEEIQDSVAAIEKARSMFGFVPQVPLAAGLSRMVNGLDSKHLTA